MKVPSSQGGGARLDSMVVCRSFYETKIVSIMVVVDDIWPTFRVLLGWPSRSSYTEGSMSSGSRSHTGLPWTLFSPLNTGA